MINLAQFFMKSKLHFIGPRRRLFQWATTLLLMLLPWLEVDGKSLLRIDIPGLNLYLFGQVLRIQELYLVMLASLILVLSFLLVTVVLGRVWCGWLCPQTTLSDLAEWAARRLGLTVKHNSLHGALWRKLLLQGVFGLLALLVASNLLWYFIPPQVFFVRLVTLDLHYATWISLILTGLLVYIDLAVIRRLMCKEICPYGRVQTAIVDKATLSLHLPDAELERCIECDSCLRSCPMEIDIRHGYQVECTDCGRCLDACRKVMTRRNEPGLIRY
ncbi:MAG: 4Fe-4S dicluster domain-containing protein, partial [Thermodesulfobacteriota bacterium]